MTITGSLPHLDDVATLRLIDGELTDADAWMIDHVRVCTECASRARALQTRSETFSDTLGAIAIPPVSVDRLRPPADDLARRRQTRARARWTRAGVRVAAGLVLVAGVAAASPLRGWIVAQIARATRPTTPLPSSDATPASATGTDATVAGVGRAGTSVAFTPVGRTLQVEFSVAPAGSELLLEASDGRQVTAEGTDMAPGETFLVLPSALRIRNSAEGVARYHVVVPQAVDSILVRVAQRVVAAVAVTQGMRHVIMLRLDPASSRP